jgi:hypothetical protein
VNVAFAKDQPQHWAKTLESFGCQVPLTLVFLQAWFAPAFELTRPLVLDAECPLGLRSAATADADTGTRFLLALFGGVGLM